MCECARHDASVFLSSFVCVCITLFQWKKDEMECLVYYQDYVI